MKRYKNIDLDYGVNAEVMESYVRQQELEAAMEEEGYTDFDMEELTLDAEGLELDIDNLDALLDGEAASSNGADSEILLASDEIQIETPEIVELD